MIGVTRCDMMFWCIGWPLSLHFIPREQKLEIYRKQKRGTTAKDLSVEFNIREDGIKYLIRLIDFHGESILRKDRNRYYTPTMKQDHLLILTFKNESPLFGCPNRGDSFQCNVFLIHHKGKGIVSSDLGIPIIDLWLYRSPLQIKITPLCHFT